MIIFTASSEGNSPFIWLHVGLAACVCYPSLSSLGWLMLCGAVWRTLVSVIASVNTDQATIAIIKNHSDLEWRVWYFVNPQGEIHG